MWFTNLKKMKLAAKMTTREISTKSGIPEPTLEKLFAGVTKDPKLETMRTLVNVLGFTLDELVQESFDAGNGQNLSPPEKQLLEAYRSLNQQGKEYIRQTLDMARSAYAKNTESPSLEQEPNAG